MPQPELYSELLAHLNTCPFCEIDKSLMITEYPTAFMTIACSPYHEDHILIIPKKHITSFLDLPREEYEEITSLLHIGMNMIKRLGHENATLFVREGPHSGKTVPHLHYHIVPEVLIHSDTDPAKRILLSHGEKENAMRKMTKVFEEHISMLS